MLYPPRHHIATKAPMRLPTKICGVTARWIRLLDLHAIRMVDASAAIVDVGGDAREKVAK
jgi:hypothetical protein